MAWKELVLEFKELNLIGIECPECKAETLFDLAWRDGPSQCSVCRKAYDDAMKNAFSALRSVYNHFADQPVRVRVRLPES